MQKLQKEFKNIPTDTSLVCSPISTDLNKEDTLSDQSIVLICNNPEENLDQHTGRLLQTKVYVISKNGNPPLIFSSEIYSVLENRKFRFFF